MWPVELVFKINIFITGFLVVRGSPEGPLVSPALWSFRVASTALYRRSCVVSTECKHPTLTRSSDQIDHGTTAFDRLLFLCQLGKKGNDWRQFRTTIGPIKKKDTSGTIWSFGKKQSLVKWPHYAILCLNYLNHILVKSVKYTKQRKVCFNAFVYCWWNYDYMSTCAIVLSSNTLMCSVTVYQTKSTPLNTRELWLGPVNADTTNIDLHFCVVRFGIMYKVIQFWNLVKLKNKTHDLVKSVCMNEENTQLSTKNQHKKQVGKHI